MDGLQLSAALIAANHDPTTLDIRLPGSPADGRGAPRGL